jgi:cytochrome c oxidase subunit IV
MSYPGFTGLCHDPSNLKLYLLVQPIMILLEVVISIVDFLGFNGFVRVGENFR